MYMCVLGLCVHVRAGRPGRPGTRPTGEDPSGMSAGMSQVSMSPKSSVQPTSPLLLCSLLFLSHRIGIVRRFILQTKRMSLYFKYSKYINVESNASCFPYLQTRVHTQGSNSGAATTPSGVGKLRYRSFYLHTYTHTYTYTDIYLFARRDIAGRGGGCWARL
jgi:hypothetical protein